MNQRLSPVRVIVLTSLWLIAVACASATGNQESPPTTALNLDEVFLAEDGLGEVFFGATPQELIDAVRPFIGGRDSDTGWIDGTSGIYGACPEDLRVLTWGSLAAFFTTEPGALPRADLDSGVFFAHSYGFDFEGALTGVDPRNLDLRSIESIGLGSPGMLLNDIDGEVEFVEDDVRDLLSFAIHPQEEPHLRGTLAGPSQDDPITFIESSTGCS